MSIGKRLTSFMLSAVMIAGNMVSPMNAYAGETETGNTGQLQSESAAETTAGQDKTATSEIQPATDIPVAETEAKSYRLILPAGDGYSFTYDQNHFSEEDKEKKNVTLLYKAGDEVNLDLFAKDGYQLDKVSFTDKDKIDPQTDQLNVTYQEVSYTWKDEDTLIFTMPDKDIWMQTEFHQLQSETVAASESVQAMPDTSAQVSDAVEGNESPEASATASSEPSAIEQNGQSQEENAGDAETSVSQETDTVSSIEADGYPADGSLVMLPEMEIGSDVTAIDPKDKFEDVTYPQDTCKSLLESGKKGYSRAHRKRPIRV